MIIYGVIFVLITLILILSLQGDYILLTTQYKKSVNKSYLLTDY